MSLEDKILTESEAKVLASKLRQEKKRIVLCHGVFDLIHPGHIDHLDAAKRHGEVLFVSVTADPFVNKGPGRPIFNLSHRLKSLAALALVDFLLPSDHPTAVEVIRSIKPDYYVKGQDYKMTEKDITNGIFLEKTEVESNGGQLIFTEEVQFSSSAIINKRLNREQQEFLNHVKSGSTYNSLISIFDEIANYKVMVIGESIIDEYQFVQPLGKASKSPTLTAKSLDKEVYAGGAVALANHLSSFVENVTLITDQQIGQKEFPNVVVRSLDLERQKIVKRRFVDQNFHAKIFEIIEMDDTPLSEEENELFRKSLDDMSDFDLCIIADFGHGLIGKEMAQWLSKQNVFLCLNVQSNSANKGFNVINKFPSCNYFCIDLEEASLALRDHHLTSSQLMHGIRQLTKCHLGSITLGVDGCLVNETKAPAFSDNVVDTIGAGDAFLGITSLLAKYGAKEAEIALVGNATGAMAVQIMGNRESIQKIPLLKYLKTLLAS